MAGNEKNRRPFEHDTADHSEQKRGEDSHQEDLKRAQEVDAAQGADVRRGRLDPAGQPPRPEEDTEKQVGGQRR